MYNTRQVADLLEVPAWKVREYARAGFLSPEKDHLGYKFEFADLVVLRTAVRLAGAEDMSHRRIQRTLGQLRAQLPDDRSLTEVGIAATGPDVVVMDGPMVWEPETGQCHFNFGAATVAPGASDSASQVESEAPALPAEPATSVAPALPTEPVPEAIPLGRAEVVAQGWFDLGCEQEASRQDDDAIASYRRAISIYPQHSDAHVNLGRLLQTRRKFRDARTHYEQALEIAPYNSTAAFNLALVYQRMKRVDQATEMYERTLELDPDLADAHYNLARLYETAGRPADALRHFQLYKKLTGSFKLKRTRKRRR